MRAKRDTYSKTLESFWSPHIRISAIDRKVSTKRFLFASVTTWFLVNTWYWYLWDGIYIRRQKVVIPVPYLSCSSEWAFLGFHTTSLHQFFCRCHRDMMVWHDLLQCFDLQLETNRAAPSAITRMRGFTITIETTMDAVDAAEPGVQGLELVSVIGFGGSLFYFKGKRWLSEHLFAGKTPGGLISHPDGHHIIYPLGCTVIVEDIKKRKQSFLSGHSDSVSCLACSASGNFLASGQVCQILLITSITALCVFL